MTGADLATAAQGLAGARFRLHGRDPAHGLDCIGVLQAAMARAGQPIDLPCGYTMRVSNCADWLPDPGSCGFMPASQPWLPGDVVLLQPSPGQVHLAIAVAGQSWVHAHAGLRRVVIAPALPLGALLHHWRLRPPS